MSKQYHYCAFEWCRLNPEDHQDIRYFRPRARSKEWAQIIGGENYKGDLVVCDKHFSEKNFVTVRGGRRRLVSNAIPDKNLKPKNAKTIVKTNSGPKQCSAGSKDEDIPSSLPFKIQEIFTVEEPSNTLPFQFIEVPECPTVKENLITSTFYIQKPKEKPTPITTSTTATPKLSSVKSVPSKENNLNKNRGVSTKPGPSTSNIMHIPVNQAVSSTPAILKLPVNKTGSPTPALLQIPTSQAGSSTPAILKLPVNKTGSPTPALLQIPVKQAGSSTPAILKLPANKTAAPTPALLQIPRNQAGSKDANLLQIPMNLTGLSTSNVLQPVNMAGMLTPQLLPLQGNLAGLSGASVVPLGGNQMLILVPSSNTSLVSNEIKSNTLSLPQNQMIVVTPKSNSKPVTSNSSNSIPSTSNSQMQGSIRVRENLEPKKLKHVSNDTVSKTQPPPLVVSQSNDVKENQDLLRVEMTAKLYCRTCMRRVDDSSRTMLCVKCPPRWETLYDLIVACIPSLQGAINKTDVICSICQLEVINYAEFVRKCLKTNEKWLSIMNKHVVPPRTYKNKNRQEPAQPQTMNESIEISDDESENNAINISNDKVIDNSKKSDDSTAIKNKNDTEDVSKDKSDTAKVDSSHCVTDTNSERNNKNDNQSNSDSEHKNDDNNDNNLDEDIELVPVNEDGLKSVNKDHSYAPVQQRAKKYKLKRLRMKEKEVLSKYTFPETSCVIGLSEEKMKEAVPKFYCHLFTEGLRTIRHPDCDPAKKKKVLLLGSKAPTVDMQSLKPLFQCFLCGKLHASIRTLRTHYIRHYGNECVTCSICKMQLISGEELAKHTAMVHEFKPEQFHCERCKKTFKNRRCYMAHLRRTRGLPTCMLDCEKCGQTHKTMASFKRHLEESRDVDDCKNKFRCIRCNEVVKRKQYRTHMNMHYVKSLPNLPAEKQIWLCDVCGRSFQCHGHLVMHAQSHKPREPTICPYCGVMIKHPSNYRAHIKSMHTAKENIVILCDQCPKKFRNKTNFKRHKMLVHEQIVKYKCDECSKKFVSSETYKSHRRVAHDNVKPYICHICQKAYARSDYLRKHLAIHEKYGDKYTFPMGRPRAKKGGKPRSMRPCICKYCGRICGNSNLLRAHYKVHVKYRPLSYKCQYCDLVSTSINNKVRHEKLHKDPDFKFRCKVCFHKFPSEEVLEIHMKKHDKLRYECNICNKRFARNYLLENHKTLDHQDHEEMKARELLYKQIAKEDYEVLESDDETTAIQSQEIITSLENGDNNIVVTYEGDESQDEKSYEDEQEETGDTEYREDNVEYESIENEHDANDIEYEFDEKQFEIDGNQFEIAEDQYIETQDTDQVSQDDSELEDETYIQYDEDAEREDSVAVEYIQFHDESEDAEMLNLIGQN